MRIRKTSKEIIKAKRNQPDLPRNHQTVCLSLGQDFKSSESHRLKNSLSFGYLHASPVLHKRAWSVRNSRGLISDYSYFSS